MSESGESSAGARPIRFGTSGWRGVLGEATEAFHAVLDRHTLADLTANRTALVRVLGIAS